jgi:chromate transporter
MSIERIEKREPPHRKGVLAELALFFLKLGAVSFGGPAAHIPLMEEEAVERRKWVPRAQFLDMVAATNLIPGAALSSLLAWTYDRYGALLELRLALPNN